MPSIQVDNNQLSYDVRGEGPAAILFNHSGASSLGWSECFLEKLAEEFTVITFDYRGTGNSSPVTNSFVLADLAADGKAILEAGKISKAVVIGTSMGGAVAQEFALAYPHKVSVLVLLGTFAGLKHFVQPDPKILELLKSPSTKESSIARWQRLLPTIYSDSFLQQHGVLALDLELKGSRFTTVHTIAKHGEAVGAFEVYDRLPAISAPTLIIHGTDDPIIPVRNGEILASRISGSEYVELQGVGHLPAVEKPFEIAKKIGHFSRQNGVSF